MAASIPGQAAPDVHGGEWTCDCGRVESGYRSVCVECGTHVTERECENA